MPHRQDAYRAICAAHAGVPLFHQPWWLDAVCDNWTGVMASQDGKASGIWPVPLERKLGVRLSRTPMLAPYLGPAFLFSADTHPSSTEELQERLTRELLLTLPKLPVWSVAAQPGEWNTSLFSEAGFRLSTRTTFLLPLQGGEEQLFAVMHAGIRRDTRRAAESLTIADEPEFADAMYALQRATLHRKGSKMHHSFNDFKTILVEAHNRGCCALWVARRGGVIVGAQWSVWDARRCYNLGLARAEGPAGKYVAVGLLWHAICHSRKLGLEIFDFEGSSIPSIAEFFARFGGEKSSYLTLHKNNSAVWRLVRRLRP